MIDEIIRYGHTINLDEPPKGYSDYENILKDAQNLQGHIKKPVYIFERTEHYELVGVIEAEVE